MTNLTPGPMVVFSDESYNACDEQLPYVRAGVVCAEHDLLGVRGKIITCREEIYKTAHAKNVNDLKGKEFFNLRTDSRVEPHIDVLSRLFVPTGPISPIIYICDQHDGASECLGSSSYLPQDALSVHGMDKHPRLAATALALEQSFIMFQDLISKLSACYGMVVCDNFGGNEGTHCRYITHWVGDRFAARERTDSSKMWLAETALVPSWREPMLQLADVIAYFFRRDIEGKPSSLAQQVRDSVQNIRKRLAIETCLDGRRKNSTAASPV